MKTQIQLENLINECLEEVLSEAALPTYAQYQLGFEFKLEKLIRKLNAAWEHYEAIMDKQDQSNFTAYDVTNPDQREYNQIYEAAKQIVSLYEKAR
jgi:hypothetical protein